jgi:predicted DsbA family dithiol-disulfide isomerase
MTYNSRLAQELGSWADTQEGGGAIHDRLFRAYFVDNVNIGDKGILLEITKDSGLDADQARDVLDHRLFSQQVTMDWQRAWENGITGVPTFTSQELYVVGNQPYEVLLRFINHLRDLNAEK